MSPPADPLLKTSDPAVAASARPDEPVTTSVVPFSVSAPEPRSMAVTGSFSVPPESSNRLPLETDSPAVTSRSPAVLI